MPHRPLHLPGAAHHARLVIAALKNPKITRRKPVHGLSKKLPHDQQWHRLAYFIPQLAEYGIQAEYTWDKTKPRKPCGKARWWSAGLWLVAG